MTGVEQPNPNIAGSSFASNIAYDLSENNEITDTIDCLNFSVDSGDEITDTNEYNNNNINDKFIQSSL